MSAFKDCCKKYYTNCCSWCRREPKEENSEESEENDQLDEPEASLSKGGTKSILSVLESIAPPLVPMSLRSVEIEPKESGIKSILSLPKRIPTMSMQEIGSQVEMDENIYALARSVMQCYVGQPTYPFFTKPKQLYPYILCLCSHMEQSIIDRIYPIHEPKVMELTLVIQEAQILHPKFEERDFVNVYCKIWTDAGIKRKTAIRRANLKLLWDDVFVLKLKKFPAEVLHIEVWSVRPGVFKSKAAAESGNKTYAESDYLIGDTIVPVNSLPCVGQDVLWPLKKGPRRVYTRGQLKLFIQLCARKEKDHIYHIYMYMKLMILAYEKNMKFLENTSLWKNWLEILPNPALTLIQQLALQHGIRPTEQCICSWILASTLKMKGEGRMSFYLLHILLEGLISDIASDPVEDYMESALINSIEKFSVHIFETLRNLHQAFDIESKDNADELFYLLKCINASEIEGHENYLHSYEIVAKEAYTWYLNVIHDNRLDLQEDDQDVGKVSTTLTNIIKVFLRNQILLDDIFKRAWELTYSEMSIKALDQVVKSVIEPIIKHLVSVMQNREKDRDVDESLKMLQLYHNLRNLVNYVTHDIVSTKYKLCMDEHSLWFGEYLILDWFLLCESYTKPFIERAIILDKMERIDKTIYHGTSVPDVIAVIDEIVVDIWMKLSWKDQFFTLSALTEAIKTCVSSYVKIMSEKIDEKHFFSSKKNFCVREKLCLALSNIYAIFYHLHVTRNKILAVLGKTESECGFSVTDPVATLENELQILVSEVFHKVLRKVSRTFKVYVRKMISSSAGFLQTNALADVCTYIENTLEVMYLNMKQELFNIVLRHMWIIVVIHFNDALTCCQLGASSWFWGNKKSTSLLVLQALAQLQTIFHCDGHGLSYIEMHNKIYMELKMKIEAKLKTDE